MRRCIVKLNEGVSGEGNALVDLERRPRARVRRASAKPIGRASARDGVRARRTTTLRRLPRQARRTGRRRRGAHQGEDFRSPSVQLRVTPLGDVELLSTHDQLLGGPSGQSYLGCAFPATPEYAPTITREAEDRPAAGRGRRHRSLRARLRRGAQRRRRVGRRTRSSSTCARAGRPTRSSRCSSSPTARTTPSSDCSRRRAGSEKYFVATRPRGVAAVSRGLTPDDLFDIVVRHGLHFDQSRQTGVVFHMISCARPSHGRFGLTAVGDTPEEAHRRYREAERILLEEARLSLEERPLPV